MLARKSLLFLPFPFLLYEAYASNSSPMCKGGVYAEYASLIVSYQPAQQFCSQHYPLPVATTTVVRPTSTVTKTVATATVTNFIATQVQTSFYSTTTVTNTVTTATETTTVTTATQIVYATSDSLSVQTNTIIATVTASETITVEPRKKRDAPRTTLKISTLKAAASQAVHAGNLLDQIWQEAVQLGEEIVGNVCDCIETQATHTVTATPLVTQQATATVTAQATTTVISSFVSTMTVTATGTVTVSATATTLVTSTVVSIIPTTTATTTTTTTTTTTAALPGPTCNNNGKGNPYSFEIGCSERTTCFYSSTCWVSSSFDTCNDQCDQEDPDHQGTGYDFGSGYCYCYHSCCPS